MTLPADPKLPRGVTAALLAALLFGAGTPAAKVLLAATSPWLLAALLYLGSGIGLFAWRRLRRAAPVRPANGAGWPPPCWPAAWPGRCC